MARQLLTKDLLANFPGIGRIRRIAKVLGWLITGGFVFVVAANFFDEDLHPEAAAYRRIAPPGLPADGNAYYAVAGLGAPLHEDAHAAGRRLVSQLEEAEARKLRGEPPAWPDAFTMNLLVRKGLAARSICDPARDSCIAWVSRNHQEAAHFASSNQVLLARYRALHDYPGYATMRTPQFWAEPSHHAGPLLQVQRIFFVQMALQLQRGELAEVLTEVRKDIAFGRKALAGTRDVYAKSSMNRQLANSVLFLSEVLAHRRGQIGPRATAFEEVLRPLDTTERRLAEGLQAHFVMHAMTIDEVHQGEGWEEKLFGRVVKRNATLNHAFRAYKVQSDADAVPAAKYVAQAGAVQAMLPSPDWTYFYNFFGKTISDLSRFDNHWLEYQYQMYDLDALLRLVALQAQIVARRIDDKEAQQFVSGADARYHNPYTNLPMSWYENAAQLCYEPQSSRYGNPKAPPACCATPMAGKPGRVCVRLSPASA